ncbi:heavy-metal-associated domain-containing protein [Staphylococcus rostri]|uniref:Metal-binding protein n=1 Tax=Staphylococcus rostri TaxID=522262 RepID=A0A2K3YPY4_9STAP|nr:heavy-metal-associated domain-containing protein [Staphylococcus rostri]PNZ27298.1 metal-binding protein [Staphylococcus rostri]
MKQAILKLETLTCPSCMQKIESALKRLDGVESESVKVLFNASKAKANFDPAQVTLGEVVTAVESVGYTVLKSSEK